MSRRASPRRGRSPPPARPEVAPHLGCRADRIKCLALATPPKASSGDQRAAADAARNAALLAQQRYSSGLIDFQSVLETQRTLLSTQESVATTTAAVAADHVRLYKALGGGWAVAE